jgi:AraC-like DNA-binding protein
VPLRSDVADFTASTAMTWLLLTYLRRRGVDLATLLANDGLDLGSLVAPGSRMRLVELQRLWRSAARVLGDDEALGARVAGQIDPLATLSWSMPFSLLETISRVSPTMREGIDRQRPFLRLMRDGFSVAVEDWHGGRCLVRWEFATPESEPRELVDFHLGIGVMLSRRTLANRGTTPIEVWFTQREPKDLGPYHALFGPNLRFSAECNALVANASHLQLPLPNHDPVTLQVVEYQGRKLVEQLPSLEDFVARVREHIEAELPHGNTTAGRVADKLAISGRTLHRRLRSHGTTYQEQLDQVRYKLAMKYLASRRYPLGEVASLVGFAQQSAFQRAFKTWAGQTPAEYQQHGAARTRSHVGV